MTQHRHYYTTTQLYQCTPQAPMSSSNASRDTSVTWRRVAILLGAAFGALLVFNVLPQAASRASRPRFNYAPTTEPKSTTTSAAPTTDATVKAKIVLSPDPTFGDAKADNDWQDGLSAAQCSATFPDLYNDIDRAVTYWKTRGHNITEGNVRIKKARAAIRIIIHNNEIRVLESKDSVDAVFAQHDRAYGVLNMIHRALAGATAVGEIMPTVEIALNFQDDADYSDDADDMQTYWTFARTLAKESHQRSWLMPNFDFWYYHMTGSFPDAKRAAMRHDGPFKDKIQKVAWRGSPNYGPELRNALIDATKGKPWADVLPVLQTEDPPISIAIDRFCDYAMTVYTEGVTYSGRLKFLMNCQSLLLVHDLEYRTHYSHLLVGSGPKQNYVPVKRDWSDLEQKVEHYLARPDEAEKIIANNLATFRSRYNTRAAISCYIRRLIQAYASVSHTPDVSVAAKDGFGPEYRGWSFEKFMDAPVDASFEQYEE